MSTPDSNLLGQSLNPNPLTEYIQPFLEEPKQPQSVNPAYGKTTFYKVSDLTTGLIITHLIVSFLVVALYDKISILKNRKFIQKYKNVVLWGISLVVIALILLDMSARVDLSKYGGVTRTESIILREATPTQLVLFGVVVLHLIVSVVLVIPYFYNKVIFIVPTKSFKNQLLWLLSAVVCVVMLVIIVNLGNTFTNYISKELDGMQEYVNNLVAS